MVGLLAPLLHILDDPSILDENRKKKLDDIPIRLKYMMMFP